MIGRTASTTPNVYLYTTPVYKFGMIYTLAYRCLKICLKICLRACSLVVSDLRSKVPGSSPAATYAPR